MSLPIRVGIGGPVGSGKTALAVSLCSKLYPKYDSMAVSAKVKADQIVMQRFGKRIDKFTKRAAMKLRRQEPDRVKKFRSSQQAVEK